MTNTWPSSPRPGLTRIDIEPTRVYSIEDARQFLTGEGIDADAIAPQSRRQIHERVYPRRETSHKGVLWPGVL